MIQTLRSLHKYAKLGRKALLELMAHRIAKGLGLGKAFARPVRPTHERMVTLERAGEETSRNRPRDECARLGMAIEAELEAAKSPHVVDWSTHYVNVFLNN